MSNQTNDNIKELTDSLLSKVKKLPPTEFSYYITLLSACVMNEKDSDKYYNVIEKADILVTKIGFLYQAPLLKPSAQQDKLDNVLAALNTLVNEVDKHDSSKITDIISKTIGAVLAIITGILFSFIGATVGLVYGIPTFYKAGNVIGGTLGFVSGLAIGLLYGYRAPSKLLSSNITHKMGFVKNRLACLGNELNSKKSTIQYEEETKNYILDTFFKKNIADKTKAEKQEIFNTFMKTEQTFQICSKEAGHITKTLKGFLGHHALIRFNINGTIDIPIEFGDREKTPKFVNQYEQPRKVSGQKLFKMLVLDRILQETHGGTKNALAIYDIGSDDCRTYIDKILIGTGQEPTKLKRFSSKNDKWVGSKLVAPLITFYSTIKESELFEQINTDREIIEQAYNDYIKKNF